MQNAKLSDVPLIHMVSAHAEGEVGSIIKADPPAPLGETLWELRDWRNADGSPRDPLLNEPQKGVLTRASLLTRPCDPCAVTGTLVMEPMHLPPMSGSNAMCIAAVHLKTEPVPAVRLGTDFSPEVPAGLVSVRTRCAEGLARSTGIMGVPDCAGRLNASLDLANRPTLAVDTACGGDGLVLVDAVEPGLSLSPDEDRDIADPGTEVVNEQPGFSHPERPWPHISFCHFMRSMNRSGGDLEAAEAIVIDPKKTDLSPCSIGCSGRITIMNTPGELLGGDATSSSQSLTCALTAASPVSRPSATEPRPILRSGDGRGSLDFISSSAARPPSGPETRHGDSHDHA